MPVDALVRVLDIGKDRWQAGFGGFLLVVDQAVALSLGLVRALQLDLQVGEHVAALQAGFALAQAVRDFALRLVLATHPEIESSPENVRRFVRFGASPRAAQAIIAAARVRALMAGRYNVAYEDIEALAPACLRHRIALSFEGMAEGETAEGVIAGLLKTLPRE